jgi:prepilin-type N-terminal cleavage/methylation domain-containing protein
MLAAGELTMAATLQRANNRPAVTKHGIRRRGSAHLPSSKRLQGAGDARHRSAICTGVHEQADNTADSVPCDRLRPAGFTLLEILVAVAILGMAYLVVLQNFSHSLRNIERVELGGLRSFTTLLAREPDLMTISSQRDGEPLDGEIYVAGQKFQVVLVEAGETAGQAILLLERRP